MSTSILVAGGGIGGLATALGLAQKGHGVVVLEKAAALGEIGAGIQLGPNSFHSFDYLGVGDAARAMDIYIDGLRLMDAINGEEICRIPLDAPFRERFGNPYAVVHRGDLHGVFLRACQASSRIELRTSSEVAGYDQDGVTVTARLAIAAATSRKRMTPRSGPTIRCTGCPPPRSGSFWGSMSMRKKSINTSTAPA